MSFNIDTAAITAASKRLEVVGNNLSNANTVGFKGANFEQVLATSMSGDVGTKKAGARYSFTQGNIQNSANPLDMAIRGNGFFRVVNNGDTFYTRNGQFLLDNEGNVVNSTGDQLTGYAANADGDLMVGLAVPLQVDLSDYPPTATTEARLSLTLDSRGAVPTAAFNVNDPSSYSHSTTTVVYDQLGDRHDVQSFYRKTANNAWDVYAVIDGNTAGVSQIMSLNFNDTGRLVDPAAATASLDINGSPVAFNLADTQQYASGFVATMRQDGSPTGQMLGYAVEGDGRITARYSNGATRLMGQVLIANFASVDGLASVENNQWRETAASGPVALYTPGTVGQGVIEGGAVEQANIDLTAEMIKLIEAQRIFQAAAEMVKKQDEVMQTSIGISR